VPQSGRIRIPARAAVCAVLAAVAMGLAVPSVASAQVSAARVCPFTFDVLHDDHIGRLSLPRGAYRITVSGPLSCAGASDLFRQFLEDFDGRLPRPWVLNVATATFRRGSGSATSFSVRRVGNPGGGGGGRHPATGVDCPASFRVLHNDRVGPLRLRRGNYWITLLSVGRLSCARASRDFGLFLRDFDGRLPRPWTLDPETGTFQRGRTNVGFRVKRIVGPAPRPGGGGEHPADGRLCPGTFRVLHRDRIGRLRLPAGPYRVTLLPGRGLSCQGASRRFGRFLNHPNGRLPRPWVLNVQTGTFRRGPGSRVGFRVKPVRRVR
jgi:hypothetical protein